MKNNYKINKTLDEWKSELTEEEFRILRLKGTELPFSGEYNKHDEEGIYFCRGCSQPLFSSENKFNSNCGWPSYDKEIEGSLEQIEDTSAGMIRTEIVCSNCGGHQGHVFNDGPTSTGLRFCVNSSSISFKKVYKT